MNKELNSLIIGDRFILKSEITHSFHMSIQERLNCAIKMMNLPSEIIEPIYCSSLNKHTCIQQTSSTSNNFFFVADEHLHEILSALLLIFYMVGYHDCKYTTFFMATKILNLPIKRLNYITILLHAEKDLLEGNATSALFFVNKLEKSITEVEVYEGDFGKLEFNYFLLKHEREQHAIIYVENFYVFHELAHVKMAIDSNLRDAFFKLVEMQIEQLKALVNAIDTSVVDMSLLPIEDIACDAYALSLLFSYVHENTGEYDFDFMVESYVFSVLSLTELDTILERRISMIDWHKTSWWRIFIALEIVYLCNPADRELRNGIIEVREAAKNKYNNYATLLDEISYKIKDSPIVEKHIPFSEEWNNEVAEALSIIRSIK